MSWWIADLASRPSLLVSMILWVIGSIVLHELAHGFAAIRCGDRTPIETGHMTLNPLVHMGPMSLLMFALVGIAWGQMPVNPRRFRGRNDDALVAFAGPAMNLVLATIAIVLGGLWLGLAPANGALYANTSMFFFIGAKLNLVLLLLNLMPVPPLDGSTIAATYSAGYRQLRFHPNFPTIAMVALLVIFAKGGPLMFDFASRVSNSSMGAIADLFR